MGSSIAAAVGLADISEGDLIISEIMAEPDSTDWYRGEWIELYNDTAWTIDLDGLIVSSSQAGSIEVVGELLVAPGDYVVLATRSNSAVNGGNTEVDYQYSVNDMTFADSYTTVTIETPDGVTLDELYYPEMFQGIAWARDDYDGLWCLATEAYGDGDLGTPGAENSPCTDRPEAGELRFSEVMVLPSATDWYRGQWIEIENTTDEEMSLLDLVVSDSDGGSFTIDADLRVSAGGHALLALRDNSYVNGGLPDVDFVYSTSDLTLSRGDSLTLTGAETLDSISWSSSDVLWGTSRAIGYADESWCDGSEAYGDGDLGTPGAVNSGCSDTDADGDGYTLDFDCDDSDPSINPGSDDLTRDDIDQDCSGADFCEAPTALDSVDNKYTLCSDYPAGVSVSNLTIGLSSETDMSHYACVCDVGTLSISGHNFLTSLDGLENLQTARIISLHNISTLTSIEGLSGLEEAESIRISTMPNLTSLDGMENLWSLGSLRLSHLDSLSSTEALSGLEELTTLRLSDVPLLTSLGALSNLTRLTELYIDEGTGLTDLTGLDNVTALGWLTIKDDHLTSLAGLESVTILVNLTLYEDVMAGRDLTDLESIEELSYLYLYSAGLDSLAGLEDITEMEDLYIEGSIGTTAALQGLESLGYLVLTDYDGDLAGFESLQEVTYWLEVDGDISDEAPFPSLSTAENLRLRGTWAAAGLENLTTTALFDLQLDGITDVDTLTSLTSAEVLSIQGDSLVDLDGLSGLTTLEYGLEIIDNPALSSVSGLEGVTSIGGNVTISGNSSLASDDITALLNAIGYSNIGGTITVEDNAE